MDTEKKKKKVAKYFQIAKWKTEIKRRQLFIIRSVKRHQYKEKYVNVPIMPDM